MQLHNCDNLELMATLKDGSIDVICIDPPYLYLKGQKLERAFDEQRFFAECKRLLAKDGFMVMFGRGTSFYRWNTILADLDFEFKEEIIWNKSYSSSPLLALSRVHETISIATKGNGTINRIKIPYLEMKGDDMPGILQDVKRLKSILHNPKSLAAVEDFLLNNNLISAKSKTLSTTISGGDVKVQDRSAAVVSIMQNGLNEKSIIRTDITSANPSSKRLRGDCNVGDRAANCMQSIEFGLNEKSIVREVRDHYSAIHPTQKPVRLLERLLALVIPKNKPRHEIVVADFFAGSMSTMEAVHNMGMRGIACEIDKEYFEDGKKRIDALVAQSQQNLFAD